MAKQTIIVMSDSHGDRAIVEEIKNYYLGKVDGIFHNGDSELPSDDPVWEGIHVVAGNMDFYDGYPDRLVTDLNGTRIAQAHGHLFQLFFSKARFVGPRRKCGHLSLWPPTYSGCLDGREDSIFKSRVYQSATRFDYGASLC